MPLSLINKFFGHPEPRPAQALAKRLEKLLRDIEKPRALHPAKFWFAKEVKKSTSPTLLTVNLEKKSELAVLWAQNRELLGLMLFAQSKWPTIDYDLWAYTREKHRGHNIAKLTLAEGIRQLALSKKDSVLTAEILIENQRTRQGAVRWLKVLGFIASQSEKQTSYKRLFMAAYTKSILQKALIALPTEFQVPDKKIPPMPPDILTKFTKVLSDSYSQGGYQLLERRRSKF
jgi:hypothetical protein